jgi:hypothetical protein
MEMFVHSQEDSDATTGWKHGHWCFGIWRESPHRTVIVDAFAVLCSSKAVIKEEQADVTKVFCLLMTLFTSQKELLP